MPYNTTQTYTNMIVDIEGPFDSESARELRSEFESYIENGKRDLVINLRDCEFLDSSGIGAIVYAYKRLSAEGRVLTLCGVHGQPLQLIEMLHIHHTIPMMDINEPKYARGF